MQVLSGDCSSLTGKEFWGRLWTALGTELFCFFGLASDSFISLLCMSVLSLRLGDCCLQCVCSLSPSHYLYEVSFCLFFCSANSSSVGLWTLISLSSAQWVFWILFELPLVCWWIYYPLESHSFDFSLWGFTYCAACYPTYENYFSLDLLFG